MELDIANIMQVCYEMNRLRAKLENVYKPSEIIIGFKAFCISFDLASEMTKTDLSNINSIAAGVAKILHEQEEEGKK